jgi:ornithine carbamoyltransferase
MRAVVIATPLAGPGPHRRRLGVPVYSSGSEPYRVNAAIINSTDRRKVKFMCCLLAFNDRNTIATLRWIRGITPESTEDPRSLGGVSESGANTVPDQAGNRLHTIEASLVAMPGG